MNYREPIEFLPDYYKKDAGTWFDLSKAFKATVHGWDGIAKTFRNGFIFRLANDEQLKFLEIMLKVPVDETLPRGYRIGRLQAKLVPHVTTLEVIKEIAKSFYPNEPDPIIDELGADYTIEVTFTNMKTIPADIQVFIDTIVEILQADLNFIVRLDTSMSAYTHNQLHAFTHTQLAAYKHGQTH